MRLGEALRARPPCGSLRSVPAGPGGYGIRLPPVLLSQHLLIKGRLRHPLAARLIPNGQRATLRATLTRHDLKWVRGAFTVHASDNPAGMDCEPPLAL